MFLTLSHAVQGQRRVVSTAWYSKCVGTRDCSPSPSTFKKNTNWVKMSGSLGWIMSMLKTWQTSCGSSWMWVPKLGGKAATEISWFSRDFLVELLSTWLQQLMWSGSIVLEEQARMILQGIGLDQHLSKSPTGCRWRLRISCKCRTTCATCRWKHNKGLRLLSMCLNRVTPRSKSSKRRSRSKSRPRRTVSWQLRDQLSITDFEGYNLGSILSGFIRKGKWAEKSLGLKMFEGDHKSTK